MKNTDLRIGNIIQYNDWDICPVIGISEFGLDFEFKEEITYIEYEQCSGIPLTEEILLRCGFEDVSSYKDYWLTIEDDLRIEIALRHSGRVYTSISDVGVSSDIKYIHQLQNLYHALTGQELKIEL